MSAIIEHYHGAGPETMACANPNWQRQNGFCLDAEAANILSAQI